MTKDGVARSTLAKQPSIYGDSKTPRKGSNQDALKTVQGMVTEWLSYRKKLLKSWERDTKLYNNERVEKHYEGLADTFVPMAYSTIESISAALITGDFNTQFIPQDIYKYLKDRLMPGFTGTVTNENGQQVEEAEEQYLVRAMQNAIKGGTITLEALDVINAFFDYAWEKGNWDEELCYGIDDGLITGNGAWWMSLENGLPKLVNVPFPDCVFSPTSSDNNSLRFGGRRYYASLQSIKDEVIIDPTTGQPKKRYKDLDKVTKKSTNNSEDKTDKELLEEMILGSTLDIPTDKDAEIDQVEVIEIMTDERMYTLINRKVLAEDAENFITAQAKLRDIDTSRLILIPLIIWSNNKRKSLLIGRSEISTFWKEQERLNDTTNQKSDAVTQSLLRQKRADPKLKAQAKSMSVPGAVIWGDSGQYEELPPAVVPAAAFNEENSIKNNIRETTATDQIIKGVSSSQDVTATEAKLQVAQSGQRIDKKIKQLQNGPLKRIARLGLQYIRLFVTDPFIVPQSVNNGITPLLYDPAKYNYDFEPKVTLTVDAQAKQRQEKNAATEGFKIVIQDPSNNLLEAKKIVYPKMLDLDKDEVERIITPAQQAPTIPPVPGTDPQQPMPDPQMTGAAV